VFSFLPVTDRHVLGNKVKAILTGVSLTF
jgi:hypothetical protein